MDAATNLQLRTNALQIIQHYRVPDLQALLKYARLSQQGNKRELFQRCKILLSSHVSSQLLNKINQIETTRLNATKSHQLPVISKQIISSPPTPPNLNLPVAKQIQFVNLPFYEKMRTIECINISTDYNTFPPLRFLLTEFDVDLISKGLARVFLRLVPTTGIEKQNDVLPPYLFVQCNGQMVVHNNSAKTVGSQAHSIAFPTDITDKLIAKVNIPNILNYLWLQIPSHMSLKNLPKSYTLALQLVRSISLDTLVNNVLKREISSKRLDDNNNNNNNDDDDDSDIEIEDLGLMTTRQRVSLRCPITQSILVIPVKSNLCSHLTCFDLRSFLQMNQKRLQWTCPVCKKSAAYETLNVDKHLQAILTNLPPNCTTVEIDPSTKILADCQYIIEGSDGDDDEEQKEKEEQSVQSSEKKSSSQKSNENECIVLSSEDEDEDENEHELYSSHPLQTFQSLLGSNFDETTYWDDIARFTCELLTNDSNNNNNNNNHPPYFQENNLRCKRNNSPNTSLVSTDGHRQKRLKSTQSTDVEIITLSSSDSSDNDEDL